jgi:cytochrome oxidase assembly protein ShyY1
MPAIIDSAPDCIVHVSGAKPADDAADFIIQAAYQKCAGIMTFGPGTTYGEDGAAASGAYYVLTWIGIAVTVAVIVYWVIWENRRLMSHANGGVRS